VEQTQRRNRRELIVLVLVVAAATGGWELWQGARREAQGDALARLARPGDIRMLSSQTCVFCDRARAFLSAHQVPFNECFIEQEAACAAEFAAHQAPGTPLMLIRGQAQLGFSVDRVQGALQPP
jgi:glutaredoxin